MKGKRFEKRLTILTKRRRRSQRYVFFGKVVNIPKKKTPPFYQPFEKKFVPCESESPFTSFLPLYAFIFEKKGTPLFVPKRL
jgi:hypothetical protein